MPEEMFFWTFMVQGKTIEADTPTIRIDTTPSGLISDPPPSFPNFYARCPSCRNPPTLSWLGTGTMCWLAYPVAWLDSNNEDILVCKRNKKNRYHDAQFL